MPNRTIYLPEELDEMSRKLELNLSQLTQKAIEDFVSDHEEEAIQVQREIVEAKIRALELVWPKNHLAKQRAEAGER
ncbi:MAG TPA: hypothetical protein EYG34_09095 [Acidimicrobiia bacterium]|nr:hypothetical protein [Acidimicrobiia bacterium]HIL47247.1 hypothetical protein [Acidimicrobiia bacterium]